MAARTTRHAPGKLMVAGEYAVLEPGRPAIVAAVDRYVTVTVTAAAVEDADIAIVSDLLDHEVRLRRSRQGLEALPGQDPALVRGVLAYVVSAVETIEQLRTERRLGLVPVRLSVRSDLHRAGVKTGLGSSAAVTVACTRALADHYGMRLSIEDRFRLALLAGVQVDAGPSGADLAAATWQGWVSYRAPDRQALLNGLHRHGVAHSLERPWAELAVRPLPPPTELALHVGWSGSPASTTALVADLATRPGWHGAPRTRFLDDSEQCVSAAEGALRRGETQALLDAVRTARALLTELPSIIDEPLGDSSILPTYLLCKFARRHVTVALSGDGGDELFAGYDPFKVLAKAQLYHRAVPRPVHAAVAALAARMPPSDRNMSLDFKLNRGLRGLGLRPALWNPIWLGPASPSDIAALLAETVDVEDLYSEAVTAWDNSASPSVVDRTLEFYTNFYLADDIMVKSDRAGMRNSLEVRAPFLDNDVADFARRLPSSVKLRGGVTKWVLRQSAAKRLPANLLARRKKGFGIPLARWLRDMPQDVLGNAPMLDAGTLQRFWQEHHDRKRDHRGALWCALTLQQPISITQSRTDQ